MKNFEVCNKGGKGSITLIGEISWWHNSSADFIRQVDAILAQGCEDLDAYINTPGGDMLEANEIGNQISRFKGHKYCKLGALCASSGTIVSTYFDKVEGSSNTQYMIHDPSVGLMIEHLNDFDSNKALYENLRNDALNRYHAKTGISIEELSTMMEKTTWMNAKVAKDKKFLDSVSDDKGEMPQDAAILLDKFKVPDNIKFIINNSLNPNVDMKQIALKLGLPENATEAEILAAIDRQKVASEGATENGIKLLVAMAEKKGFTKERITALAKADFENTLALVSDAPEKETLIKATAIYPEKKEVETTQSQPEQTRLSDVVDALKGLAGLGGGSVSNERASWTFSDWERKDSDGLLAMAKKDAKSFKALFKKETGKDISEEDFKNLIA